MIFRCFCCQEIISFFNAGCQFIRLLFHLHFPGFDFGKIQNVVDGGHQRVAADADDFHIFTLLRGQFRVSEQACHADNTVHGSADFMAHCCQKTGFGLGCRLGLFSGSRDIPLMTAQNPDRNKCNHARREQTPATDQNQD